MKRVGRRGGVAASGTGPTIGELGKKMKVVAGRGDDRGRKYPHILITMQGYILPPPDSRAGGTAQIIPQHFFGLEILFSTGLSSLQFSHFFPIPPLNTTRVFFWLVVPVSPR